MKINVLLPVVHAQKQLKCWDHRNVWAHSLHVANTRPVYTYQVAIHIHTYEKQNGDIIRLSCVSVLDASSKESNNSHPETTQIIAVSFTFIL